MKKIYRPLSVYESIHEDMLSRECFFDESAFAEKFSIDGRKILGLMVQSRNSRNYDAERGISGQSEMLFLCRCSDVKEVRVNNVLRINGRAYYVTEAMKVQGIYWKIRMLVNE